MAQPSQRRNWLQFSSFSLVLLFIAAHFAHHLTTALTVPLLPYIRDEFALDYTRAGLMTSAFAITNGISQMPGGWFADRIGKRLLLVTGITGVGLAALVVGFSQTYLMLALGLILMGIVGGGYHPASPALLTNVVEPKRRGWALGLHMVGGSMSYFLCPIIAAGIAAVWGWRGSFIAMAIPSIAFGIFFYFVLKQNIPDKVATKQTVSEEESTPAQGRTKRVLLMIALSTITQAFILSLVSFIPLYLVDRFGTSKGVAAIAISLVYGCGLWGGPLGGYLSDRWGRTRINIIVCIAAVPLIYLLTLVPAGVIMGGLLLVLGTAMYINTAAAQAFVVDNTTARNRSTMLGIYFFGTTEGSGVLMPAVGFIIDHMGFLPAFTISAATMLVSTIVFSLLLLASQHKNIRQAFSR